MKKEDINIISEIMKSIIESGRDLTVTAFLNHPLFQQMSASNKDLFKEVALKHVSVDTQVNDNGDLRIDIKGLGNLHIGENKSTTEAYNKILKKFTNSLSNLYYQTRSDELEKQSELGDLLKSKFGTN